MEERIQNLLKERFGRDIDNCTKSEIFEVLMVLTKQEMASRRRNEGKKKLYYISAEFLIGKLLSNNLINLGMYDEVADALKKHGRDLTEIEEMELEPSLGGMFSGFHCDPGTSGRRYRPELPFRTVPPDVCGQQAERGEESMAYRRELAGEAAGILPGAV